MNGRAEIRKHHEMLRRIAARLLALAVSAERAAGRAWPVRFFVLWLLRRGETAARAYAVELASLVAPHVPIAAPALGSGDKPGDALRLAENLRALAALFAALAHQLLRGLWAACYVDPGCLHRIRANAARLLGLSAVLPPYADTS